MIKTATLEQSKELKKLGIEIETHFVWDKPHSEKEWRVIEKWMVEDDSTNMIPTPTAEEVAGKLPVYIKFHDATFHLRIGKGDKHYHVSYELNSSMINYVTSKSLVVALTNMLVWLKRNGHLEKE